MPYVGQKPADIISTAVDTVTGAFSGNVTAGGTLGVTGAVTANAGVVVDNITIDGTTIALSSGDLTLDVAGDIVLDADGGDIILKDGGTGIGIIGNSGGATFYGGPDSGIMFNGVNINPTNGTATRADNANDIGAASYRFKDLYLSGGAFIGGTGTANKLDDFEEGTFTPTVTFGGGATGIQYHATRRSGIYTKVGNLVTYSIHIQLANKGSSTGALQITGLPFTSANNDHYIPSAVWIQAMASMSGGFPTFRVNTNSTILDAYQLTNSNYAGITNGNCTNTSAFQISGKYYV